MKNYFIFFWVSLAALFSNVALANFTHINVAVDVKNTDDFGYQSDPQQSRIILSQNRLSDKQTSKPDTTQTHYKKGSSTGSMGSMNGAERSFNTELQWRILNLLARQLFVNSHRKSEPGLQISPHIYKTHTFTVAFSYVRTGFLEIEIFDRKLGKKTRLDVPGL